MIFKRVKEIIEEILKEKGEETSKEIYLDTNLKNLGLTSFDLATLTVMIEDEFDVDIFEDGFVFNVDQIVSKLDKK
jgi:acyl carrier protein